MNILTTVSLIDTQRVRISIKNAIFYAQMQNKFHYDWKHQFMFLRIKNWVLLRLHKKYSIFFIANIITKLAQQFVNSFRILDRVERLVYKLNISDHWWIHSIFFITHLKSCSASFLNSYERFRSNHSSSVYVEDDIDILKFFELKRILNKRIIRKDQDLLIQYLIRWKKYDSTYDKWMTLKELDNASELIVNYEKKAFVTHFETSTLSIMTITFFISAEFRIITSVKKSIRRRDRLRKALSDTFIELTKLMIVSTIASRRERLRRIWSSLLIHTFINIKLICLLK